ncbi:MAG: hypothetical protein IJF73_04385, partial [Clostridia bacterium]|nr:hypothetical protein [Clostridia bacterium]
MRIIALGELTEADAALVGGKARGLDFLKKQGYTIAEGFVITELEALTEEDHAAIAAAHKALGAERCSVRSSATTEDGADFSSAGQYETCLDVPAEGLRTAIERCLASLTSQRAAAYSEAFLDGRTARMNLVVEAMVDAARAGVMFTRDPDDAAAVLIESVDGVGENLVSGKSCAYRYSLDRAALPAGPHEGNLSEELIRRLYTEGLAIAEAFGSDADLEWAVDGEGRLFWLQLRPITADAGADLFEFDPKEPLDGHLFTSRNVGEMLPGAVTPLSLSTSVLAIDYGIRDMLRKVGCLKHADDMPPFSIIVPLGYHLFFDMSRIHEMSHHVILATPSAMNVSIMGEYYEPCPPPEGKHRSLFIRLFNCIRFARFLFSSKSAKAASERVASTLTFDATETAKELYREIDRRLPALNEVLTHHYVCSSFSGSMNSALFMTLSSEFSEKAEYQAFVATILSDIEGIESADILASLSAIATALLAYCPAAATLSDGELLALLHDEAGGEAHELYLDFLSKHGHRSIKEAELRNCGWKDDEPALLRNLRTVLSGKVSAEKHAPFDPDTLFAPFKPSRRSALKWISKNARRAVLEREYSKSRIIRVIDKFKEQYRLLATRLVADGLLPDEDAIYFLTHGELGRLLAGERALSRLALSRRAIFPEAEELVYPDVSVGKPQPTEPELSHDGGAIHGVPVSRGLVFGRARIVRTVEDAECLEKGEVMVAAFTDIGWSPYYSIISALVTEVGSPLSHGAVVAREYCLPTVVNAKGATRLISTGDPVAVDATHGTVAVH